MRASSAGRLSQRSLQQHNSQANLSRVSTPSKSGFNERYGKAANLSPTSQKSNVGQEMLESKQSRKRAESDLQLLANRIALLRVEEQKALQKVQETKLRAEEILE